MNKPTLCFCCLAAVLQWFSCAQRLTVAQSKYVDNDQLHLVFSTFSKSPFVSTNGIDKREDPKLKSLMSWQGADSRTVEAAESRDSASVNLLNASLQAMGIAAGTAYTSVAATGTIQRPASSQFPGEGTFLFQDTFIKGKTREYRRQVIFGSHDDITVSNHGRPLITREGSGLSKTSHNMDLSIQPDYFPAVFLEQALSNSAIHIKRVSSRGFHIEPSETCITFSGNAKDLTLGGQVWCFDVSSQLPTRMIRTVPSLDNTRASLVVTTSYSDYRIYKGLFIPTRESTQSLGRIVLTLHLDTVTLNSSIDFTTFER